MLLLFDVDRFTLCIAVALLLSAPFLQSFFAPLTCSGFTAEACEIRGRCSSAAIWVLVASCISLSVVLLAVALELRVGSTQLSVAVVRAVSLLLVLIWSATVGVTNSARFREFQRTSALWGSVIALAASSVLAVKAWWEFLP